MTEEFSSQAIPVVTSNGNVPSATTIDKDESIASGNESELESETSTRSEAEFICSTLEIRSDALARLIERQRVETMLELRRLRLGQRPVTGQSNRERLEAYLTQSQSNGNDNNNTVPSSRPTTPSVHTADIDALASHRYVSSALSRVAFRQDLENAVRRSISMRPTVSAQRTPQTESTSSTPMDHSVDIVPTARPSVSVPSNEQVLNRPQAFNLDREENEMRTWQTMTQLQREIIVLEISDLVHRQLVSSALESDFRNHLEHNILNRLNHETPQDEQQEQRPRRIPPQAHVVHRPQVQNLNPTNTLSNLDELSSRLDGMQQMLHLLFSMQTEMQRSLRQEVASALAHGSSNVRQPACQAITSGRCTVCLTATADTVLYRCGHLCVCYMCGLNLQQRPGEAGTKCPICRAPIHDIVRVYRSSPNAEQ